MDKTYLQHKEASLLLGLVRVDFYCLGSFEGFQSRQEITGLDSTL